MKIKSKKFAVDWVEERKRLLVGYCEQGVSVDDIIEELKNIPLDTPDLCDKKESWTHQVLIKVPPLFSDDHLNQLCEKAHELFPYWEVTIDDSQRGVAIIPDFGPYK